MSDTDLQVQALAAAYENHEDAHYLRSVPDDYFANAGLVRIKNKIINGDPLVQRELNVINRSTTKVDVKTAVNSLIEEGYLSVARNYGNEVVQQAHRHMTDEVNKLLLSPPPKPSLEPPLTVHERADKELAAKGSFAYSFPEELKQLQNKLGRFYPGSISVIAADNGGGKSLYLEQMALGLASEAPGVCDFSVEMPFVHRLFRYIQHQSGANIGLDKYFEGELSKNDIQLLSNQLPKNLHIMNPMNINDVLSVAEQLHLQRGVTVFMLDFLQALQPLKGQAKYESIAYNMESIYHFSKRFPTTWIVASQYNRDGKRQQRADRDGFVGKPSNSDLLGANEIETYAWNIGHITRPDANGTDRLMHITKNRFGVLGEVPMKFNDTLLTFKT